MIAIDTNILVYAFDLAYKEKMEISKKIVEEIFSGKRKAVVTNQILAEFCHIITKKIENPLSKEDAQAIVGAILSSENWEIYSYNENTLLNALKSKDNFWDSIIAQTLKENNINEIITENTKDFLNSGIKAVNPFQKLL